MASREVVSRRGCDRIGLALKVVTVIDLEGVDNDVVIDLRQVLRTGGVSRAIGFPGSQRKPAQAGVLPTVQPERNAPGCRAMAIAAYEANQRGCIHRARCQAAGHPGPARADLRPAAIVRRRKAPRCVVHPGPAPGRYPAPLADAVGCPIDRHRARQPDRAVGRVLHPVAIGVELLVAHHLARNIAGGDGLVVLPVAGVGPDVKTVLQRCTRGRWCERCA